MPSALLRASALAAAAGSAAGFATYVPLCPNANGVPGVAAIGHITPAGGGANNKFGIDFAANGHVWNLTLACIDSDGDGWPNGWELGDPCGVWPGGAAAPAWTVSRSVWAGGGTGRARTARARTISARGRLPSPPRPAPRRAAPHTRRAAPRHSPQPALTLPSLPPSSRTLPAFRSSPRLARRYVPTRRAHAPSARRRTSRCRA